MGTDAYPVYIRPSALSEEGYQQYIAAILEEAETYGMEFEFIKTDENLDLLMQVVRQKSNLPTVLIVIDEHSAQKSAVMLVETSFYNAQSQQEFFPDVARCRMILSVPQEVPSICCNLEIGNMDWEDFARSAEADAFKVFRGFPKIY